jgi:predicted regulator of Ras-like GTPase activity (Roadblock/LC7/MglB family)
MMEKRKGNASRVFSAVCHDSLRQLASSTRGIDSACLVTGDGFEVASILADGVLASRLSAMTSSIHALGSAVVSELKMKECTGVIVDGADGILVVVHVPKSSPDMLLAVTCGKQATMGAVFFAARQHAGLLAERCSMLR